MNLLDAGKPEYKLFNALQMRFVPKLAPRFFSESELEAANSYFVKSACPHLEWKTAANQPTRSYAIKR